MFRKCVYILCGVFLWLIVAYVGGFEFPVWIPCETSREFNWEYFSVEPVGFCTHSIKVYVKLFGLYVVGYSGASAGSAAILVARWSERRLLFQSRGWCTFGR